MAFDLSAYEMVKDRIPNFYSTYKTGRIVTEIYSESDQHVTIKASLFKDAEDQSNLAPLATGYAREERGGHIDKYTENCETSAIGRALANLNLYGTLAAETGNRPSREEMSAIPNNPPDSPSEGQQTGKLAEFAKQEMKLKEVAREEPPVLAYEDTKEEAAAKAAKSGYSAQKQINADRSSGDMAPIGMPENFNCPWGYCETGAQGDQQTFLQQVAPSAIRGGIAKRENWDCDIIACRKNNLENVRPDGKQWCNAQWKKEDWFELARAGGNTDWDNGSQLT